MKKVMKKTALLTIAGMSLCIAATFSNAATVPGFPEHEIINPDTYGTVDPYDYASVATLFDTNDAGDVGYYIFANALRTEWTILWTGGTGTTLFDGVINLVNSDIDSYSEIAFESNDDTLTVDAIPGIAINDQFDLDATAGSGPNSWYDGFTFTINNLSMPGYLAFDLSINNSHSFGDTIYFGDGATQIVSGTGGTFGITAPVPEPTTMLLFGAGLAGLAGISRRKKK
ncbi:PEP-CTERM sorting domain-containing protein [Desulfosediminicola flagellatus]|uniref:PEP-CTERM sorting domain-containing protein n=1 Tax=Desulfosediminicola flagellatus TaxID=2569541 RepID=UPI001C3C486E|nr:PEP-CTERM sorting domain-containing protein [Desulfosediminicola flagellatus]